MDLLCFCSVLCLLCFVRVCLYVLCGHLLGKGLPLGSRLWCLLGVCHFPIGILGQVWYLIVSIPDLCNLITFKEGTLPEVWKDARVTALYKNKGEKSDTNNYRPVSLTSVPCRLCEKTFGDVIMKHMTDNNLFSDSQYVFFLNQRSCVLQLLKVLDYWNKSVDEGKQVGTIYLDIRKAFDSISHRGLWY